MQILSIGVFNDRVSILKIHIVEVCVCVDCRLSYFWKDLDPQILSLGIR